ncbi:MAG: type II toxin-antitoxin system VapC family toxin [Anaerolineales bacterium]
MIFLDTSGLFALLDSDDRFYEPACEIWGRWNTQKVPLLTSNYVLLETSALVQRRLGLRSLQVLHTYVLLPVEIHWISKTTHQDAVTNLITANRRQLSLVDCSSFTLMRALGLQQVFTFDQHFAEQGFTCLPQP